MSWKDCNRGGTKAQKRPRPGDLVRLTQCPAELLRRLPSEDRRAIKEMAGKAVVGKLPCRFFADGVKSCRQSAIHSSNNQTWIYPNRMSCPFAVRKLQFGAVVVVISHQVPFQFNHGWMGVVVNLIAVSLATMNLFLDFDFIESGARKGAPQYLEWYAAFGLMVTMIWLYREILQRLIEDARW